METVHTNWAALAEEEEEDSTSAVLPQAGKAAVSGGSLATETLASGIPACSKIQVKESISRSEAQATMPEGCLYCQLSSMQLPLRRGNAALQVLSKCRTGRKQLWKSLFELELVGERTRDGWRARKNLFTFSIFCSQPLQVLLLDLAYSAAKSFRLFSALPPPSCSPPFPEEQSEYWVALKGIPLLSYSQFQIVSSLN